MLRPDVRLSLLLAYAQFLIDLINFVGVPWHVAFDTRRAQPPRTALVIAAHFLDALSIMRLIIYTRRVVRNEQGVIVEDIPTLSRRYCWSGRFALDALSLLPADLVVVFTSLCAYWDMFRLLRLLRLPMLFEAFSESHRLRSMGIANNVSRMAKLLLMNVLVAHLIACTFFFCICHFEDVPTCAGAETCEIESWKNFVDRQLVDDCRNRLCAKSINMTVTSMDELCRPSMLTERWSEYRSDYYVAALYWAMTVTTTVGLGDIQPRGYLETMLALVFVVVGVIVYALVFGNFSDMIRELSHGAVAARADKRYLLRYLRFSEMLPEARARVSAHYSVMQTAVEEDDWQEAFDTVLRSMPSTLVAEVRVHLYAELLAKMPIFETFRDQGFVNALVCKMARIATLPNSLVLSAGEIGRELYFLISGSVHVGTGTVCVRGAFVVDGPAHFPSRSKVRQQRKASPPFASSFIAVAAARKSTRDTLRAAIFCQSDFCSYFGEIALLQEDSRRTASIMTDPTGCELGTVAASDLMKILRYLTRVSDR